MSNGIEASYPLVLQKAIVRIGKGWMRAKSGHIKNVMIHPTLTVWYVGGVHISFFEGQDISLMYF